MKKTRMLSFEVWWSLVNMEKCFQHLMVVVVVVVVVVVANHFREMNLS